MAAMKKSPTARRMTYTTIIPIRRRRGSGASPLLMARRMLIAFAFASVIYQLPQLTQDHSLFTCDTEYACVFLIKQERNEVTEAVSKRERQEEEAFVQKVLPVSNFTKPRKQDDVVNEGNESLVNISNFGYANATAVAASVPKEHCPYVVFYNIFIPSEPREATEKAVAIVKEQLEQVHKSDLPELSRSITVHYMTLGKADVLNATSMNKICSERGMICRHLSHHENGNEDIILQKAYEYCLDKRKDSKVVYLHTKGSYNEREGMNHRWRRHMTQAVTNKLCLEPANDTCTVCGLQYWPLFASIFPGNMWVGKCSYIKKLIPPVDFGQKQDDVARRVRSLVREGKMSVDLIPHQTDHMGLERWAPEHWIASHPELVPCDLSTVLPIARWTRHDTPAHFRWKMAPRAPLTAKWSFPYSREKRELLPDKNLRMKEYWLLPGRLLRWIELYNTTPPASSWAWSWFPDGDIWREAVKNNGTAVIDIMLGLNVSLDERAKTNVTK